MERVTGIRCGNEKASIMEAWYYMERVTGIEPAWSAWKAEVLPLNYTRVRMKYTTVEFSAARNMLPTYRVHMFRGYLLRPGSSGSTGASPVRAAKSGEALSRAMIEDGS